MLDGRRKSMQPMAERLGVDHQRLQRFITSSTCDFTAVRRRVAGRAVEVVAPVVWVVDDTGQVKDGVDSPGVARQYSGTLGKTGNCQVAVSVHAVTATASAPLSWRLFVPESWDDEFAADAAAAAEIARRRARCGIPDTERHRPKWRMALEMLDELAGWGHAPPVVCADAGYGEAAAFRLGLEDRGLSYIVQVKGSTTAHAAEAVPQTPPWKGTGRAPKPTYRSPAPTLRDLPVAAGREAFTTITWRQGSTGALANRFLALPVRPANRTIPRAADGALPVRLVEWPDDAEEPPTTG